MNIIDRSCYTNLNDAIEKLTQVNFVLNKRCKYTNELLHDIMNYLIECKEDKSEVDIDKLLKMLD